MSYDKRSARLRKLGVSSLSSGLTSEAVIGFYEALDCPRSLMCYLLFKYGEFDSLVSVECNPSHYNSSESFRDAYLASSFLLKSQFLETSFDRKKLALEKFNTFEERCAEVNLRLNPFRSQIKEWSVNDALLMQMRRKIGRILGTFDPLELYDLSSWGPGVSTLIKGTHTFAAKKFQHEVGITRDLHPLVVRTFPHAYPGWWSILEAKEDFPKFEVGNAIVTVPKTSKIDRVIAIEPGLNLWFQLGLGRMIRRRLGRVGIDLTDQGINQRAALLASKSGHLVTVDFSSASDSIAFELVRNLFSEDAETERWFEVMDLVRSKYGTIDGKTFRWNKFSSMGNGFTFDLETLIFYVAAIVACESCGIGTSQVSVYGDDVIVPTECYGTFSALCEYLGFSVNKQKSFSSGCFRESCGAHYFGGVDCKPIFLEEDLSLPVRVFNFANTLRLRSLYPGNWGCDIRFRFLFYKLVASVPKEIRFRVSATLNKKSGELEPLEGGFISNFDEACPPARRHWIEGFNVRRLSWVSLQTEVDYLGLLLARLSSMSVNEVVYPEREEVLISPFSPSFVKKPDVKTAPGNANPLRGRTRCSLVVTPIRRWCDLGPWF